MNKKIQIPITEEDIRMFQELIDDRRKPFTWTFGALNGEYSKGIDVEFIKDEGEE